jgi:hypothetical protein
MPLRRWLENEGGGIVVVRQRLMPSAGKQLQTSILNPARGGRAVVRVSIVGLHAWEGAP